MCRRRLFLALLPFLVAGAAACDSDGSPTAPQAIRVTASTIGPALPSAVKPAQPVVNPPAPNMPTPAVPQPPPAPNPR